MHFVVDLVAGLSLDMTSIPGGEFLMGSNLPQTSLGLSAQPVHSVIVRPFYLGTFSVSRGQWRFVQTLPQVSRELHNIFQLPIPIDVENQLPIDVVSFDEAIEFCARLKVRTGISFRLPSEAEWEYACRAGTNTLYHFGDGISLSVANYNDGITRPLALTTVGSKMAPNRFGLHDMHGNVEEWCSDFAHADYTGAPADGSAWTNTGDSSRRVLRGGSFLFGAESARSDSRYTQSAASTATGFGFRLALDGNNDFFDPILTQGGVVDAAEYSNPISAGMIVSAFGRNIGPSAVVVGGVQSDGSIARELDGTQMWFDASPAPLVSVFGIQINAISPPSLAGKLSTQIIVKRAGQTSMPMNVPVVTAAPAIFTLDASGSGQGVILNGNQLVNSAANPATPESIISVFGTGMGLTDPPTNEETVVDALPRKTVLPARAILGGLDAEVLFAGSAPGFEPGVLRLDLRVPGDLRQGMQSIVIQIGGVSSRPGVIFYVG